jgi:lysyl-tRNA synthetase class I
MNFLQKLFGGSSASPQKRYYTFSVKCNRCGEILEGRVDLDNDLSVEYEDGGDVYYARKVLMGESKCFQRVEVELKFTSSRELLERHITGGEFA